MSHATPGPWQPGKQEGTVVSALPVAGIQHNPDCTAHYGGYLIAESIAPQNIPVVAAGPTLLRRLERTTENVRGAAGALQQYIAVCRVNGLQETARAIENAIEHLAASARLNERVIARARGVNHDPEQHA